MNQPLIVLGDTTTHGGAVLSATTGFIANGIAVAGHGDIVYCPAHGIVTIQAAHPDTVATILHKPA
ncbi:hypothetical protein D3C72_2452670 [compost metagenome]